MDGHSTVSLTISWRVAQLHLLGTWQDKLLERWSPTLPWKKEKVNRAPSSKKTIARNQARLEQEKEKQDGEQVRSISWQTACRMCRLFSSPGEMFTLDWKYSRSTCLPGFLTIYFQTVFCKQACPNTGWRKIYSSNPAGPITKDDIRSQTTPILSPVGLPVCMFWLFYLQSVIWKLG